MKRLTLLSLLTIFSLFIVACGAAEPAAPAVEEAPTVEVMAEESAEEPMVEASNSIVDIAVNDGRFETLVTAVTAAGLRAAIR